MMEDKNTRKQGDKTYVMLAGGNTSAINTMVLYSRIPVFLYSSKR